MKELTYSADRKIPTLTLVVLFILY